MALQIQIQEDQEHVRNVQPQRSAKNHDFLNFSREFFATSGQMGHFRSKKGTYSRIPDFGLKVMLAEQRNFNLYKNSVWGA